LVPWDKYGLVIAGDMITLGPEFGSMGQIWACDSR
jgi:hypothetical protein